MVREVEAVFVCALVELFVRVVNGVGDVSNRSDVGITCGGKREGRNCLRFYCMHAVGRVTIQSALRLAEGVRRSARFGLCGQKRLPFHQPVGVVRQQCAAIAWSEWVAVSQRWMVIASPSPLAHSP